jgi:uncharacterized SAM-binding protein YcdF (DUF218 family)
MFSKEYIFETKRTRTKRFLKSAGIVILFFVVVFSLVCLSLPYYGKNASEHSREVFYQKAPDIIAVFTGDTGRIDHALELALEFPSSKIFISGVGAKNSLKTLLKKRKISISVDEFLQEQGHQIELDYISRNTVENTLSTLNYLNQNKSLKSLLIISSDYHVLRISTIFKKLARNFIDKNELIVSYVGIETHPWNMANLTKLFKEVWKLTRTWIFLQFWD